MLAESEAWLRSEEGRERLAEEGVYRVHVGEDESHYVGHHRDILDEGYPGLRFSFCGPRQVCCYNGLVRMHKGYWILKVIASEGPDESHRMTFGPLRGVEDVFSALAFKIYPVARARPGTPGEQLDEDIRKLERGVRRMEVRVSRQQDQIMKRVLMVLDGRLPADLVRLVFAPRARVARRRIL